ncbi:unnamed protein product [Rhizopus stolonifer]
MCGEKTESVSWKSKIINPDNETAQAETASQDQTAFLLMATTHFGLIHMKKPLALLLMISLPEADALNEVWQEAAASSVESAGEFRGNPHYLVLALGVEQSCWNGDS